MDQRVQLDVEVLNIFLHPINDSEKSKTVLSDYESVPHTAVFMFLQFRMYWRNP